MCKKGLVIRNVGQGNSSSSSPACFKLPVAGSAASEAVSAEIDSEHLEMTDAVDSLSTNQQVTEIKTCSIIIKRQKTASVISI